MKILIPLVAASVFLTGCTTTKLSRKNDLQTAELLRDYRERQQERVEKITREYQKIYADQMKRLNSLAADDFDGRLDLQRGKMADSMTAEFGASTAPSAFQIGFYSGLQDEYQFLAQIDQTISDARKAYANSYSEIQLELKKIKAAEETMRGLSIKPSARKQLDQFIRMLYAAYRETQKEVNKENQPNEGEVK